MKDPGANQKKNKLLFQFQQDFRLPKAKRKFQKSKIEQIFSFNMLTS